jgi:hypothetical protein
LALPLLLLLRMQMPDNVVVTASAPLDPQRLADALRSYLDEYGIRVDAAAAGTSADLRNELADARRLGEAVRAVAVVRVERVAPGTIEIEIMDLATEKALVATVPRPARDEDLYRSLALKIQAILRSTLSEARDQMTPGSAVDRFVSEGANAARSPPSSRKMSPAEPPQIVTLPSSVGGAAGESRRGSGRLALEAGYLVMAFPIDGPALQGLAATAVARLGHRLDLTLGSAVLSSIRAEGGGVEAVASIVPIFASARLNLTRKRAEVLFGPSAEAAVVSVAASSTAVPVRSTRSLIAALGAEAEGRLALWDATWLFARGQALAVLAGQRYDVVGTPILDTSRFEITVAIGVGVGFR